MIEIIKVKKYYKKISYLGEYDKQINPDSKIIVAIGNNIIREKISKKIKHSIGLVIDPEARISKNVFIGEGFTNYNFKYNKYRS